MANDNSVEETDKKETSRSSCSSGIGADENKPRRGFLSRIWNGIFGLHGGNDDFEKRLQYIFKEEAIVCDRMKRRSQSWRRMGRRLIVSAVVLEVIAVIYANKATRSEDLNWKMRTFRFLPMFLLLALFSAAYSASANFNRMCDSKDQKNLDRLRAQRQAKIDELKEKTNYYITQQLIQKYDPDPIAKAAAATVLASKLGADSGLKFFVGVESKQNAATGKKNDIKYVQSNGLQSRKQSHCISSSAGSMLTRPADGQTPHHPVVSERHASEQIQFFVKHYQPQESAAQDGSWLARIAASLVGDDPMQSYALICGNCHMHNGLSRKEDFSYITYYCRHCSVLNRSKQLEEQSGSTSPDTSLRA